MVQAAGKSHSIGFEFKFFYLLTSYWLCDIGQGSQPLLALVSFLENWEDNILQN